MKTIKFHDAKREVFSGLEHVPLPPHELIFIPPEKLKIRGNVITLSCYLQNPTELVKEVFVESFPDESPFLLSLQGEEIRIKIPLPPPEPPPPLLLRVPADTQVEFKATINLSDFDYVLGKEARIEWIFLFKEEHIMKGHVKIVLP